MRYVCPSWMNFKWTCHNIHHVDGNYRKGFQGQRSNTTNTWQPGIRAGILCDRTPSVEDKRAALTRSAPAPYLKHTSHIRHASIIASASRGWMLRVRVFRLVIWSLPWWVTKIASLVISSTCYEDTYWALPKQISKLTKQTTSTPISLLTESGCAFSRIKLNCLQIGCLVSIPILSRSFQLSLCRIRFPLYKACFASLLSSMHKMCPSRLSSFLDYKVSLLQRLILSCDWRTRQPVITKFQMRWSRHR